MMPAGGRREAPEQGPAAQRRDGGGVAGGPIRLPTPAALNALTDSHSSWT